MSTLIINLRSFGDKNAKVMAKKQINTQGVTQNSTSVSCIHSKINPIGIKYK